MKQSTVAIIGSFKQYYQEIQASREQLALAGIKVIFPKESSLVEAGVDFVRLKSDKPNHTDSKVEELALEKILAADFVYVVAPGGYIGKTVCYEIGHLAARNKPFYFSERPQDLPIEVQDKYVLRIKDFILKIKLKGSM